LEFKRSMQAKEINNGRVAKLAISAMVLEEFIFKQPVVKLTPWLFEPVFFFPEFQGFLDQFFAAAAFRPQ